MPRVPTRFVQKYTQRLAYLELGGVDSALAVEEGWFAGGGEILR